MASRVLDTLPSLLAQAQHNELWGIDLKTNEQDALKAITGKVYLNFYFGSEWGFLLIYQQFLSPHAAIPALQIQRATASLIKTLTWRHYSEPRKSLSDAESLLPELGLCHITLCPDHLVLWLRIDDRAIKGHSPIHKNLAKPAGLVQFGLAVMEKLATLLLLHSPKDRDPDRSSASCVIHFKTHAVPNRRKGHLEQSFQSKLCTALEDLVSLIRLHYPGILGKAYIINPCDEYLASLDIPECLLRNTVLLSDPQDLTGHLSSPHLPPEYGGTGKPLTESDLLPISSHDSKAEESLKTEIQDNNVLSRIAPEATGAKEENPTSTEIESGQQEPRLIYSETIGPPSQILDPDDLPNAAKLCPDKMGASLAFADSDTIVKYGHGVRLAEAEALHLVSTQTTIAAPKLLSAYILDGTGYILMSYERGEALEHYWDRSPDAEQNRIVEKLQSYVDQMRSITGDFIGGLGKSPCRDGIFEAGLGDYTRYSYGPYPSEESFNEGIVQALRDRLPPKVLAHEHDTASSFFNNEYILHQTVRGLRGHKIVFTHGDLHPGNMIVREDGTLVLLDWGLAGFWPEYWEFYRAMFGPGWRASWDRVVEKFVPPYYVEYSVINRVFAIVWN